LTPALSARLHKQSTFRKHAKFDRRETEIFRKLTNLLCGTVIVAPQEHDSPATMYGRILVNKYRKLRKSKAISGTVESFSRSLHWR